MNKANSKVINNKANLFNSKLFFLKCHYPKLSFSSTINNDNDNDNDIILSKYLSKDLLSEINFQTKENQISNSSSNIKNEVNNYNISFNFMNQNQNIIKFSSLNDKSNNGSSVQNKKIKKNKNKNKKNFIEREGDWTCFYCGNLNFSFRKNCNRCCSFRINSEIEHDKYMENVLYIINENQKKRLLNKVTQREY